jgi:hypothetical protein
LSGQSEFRFHSLPSQRLTGSFSIGSIGSP